MSASLSEEMTLEKLLSVGRSLELSKQQQKRYKEQYQTISRSVWFKGDLQESRRIEQEKVNNVIDVAGNVRLKQFAQLKENRQQVW